MSNRRRCGSAVLAIAVLAGGIFAPASAADAVRGRRLAIEDCSACHKVTAEQIQPAAVLDRDSAEHIVAPPFADIGRKYAADSKALRSFIHAPSYPMPEQQFLPRDFDDIVAYIQSLPR